MLEKLAAPAFREFVETNKKDFILFQLEVMLKEAGTDTVKRSLAVNNIAETLSKFSKAEDFTKQQDYIRQCAELLKIDEAGLTNLVNKLKRDRIVKDESRRDNDRAQEMPETEVIDEPGLLNDDTPQERAVLKVLLEYGLKPWDDGKTMADYILEELEHYHIENEALAELLQLYKDQYYQGLQPSLKTLLYIENENIRKMVVNLSVQQYELSPNWDVIMEGMNINNRDISRQDVLMSLNYFKLRKIKKMFDENQRDIEKADTFEKQMVLIKIHKVLKEEEQKITGLLGTVIFR